MNPRVPDMTAAATQSLSDGELFFIIRNGVRLTGMPAWGANTPADDRASWALVRFVRRLPQLTPAEIRRMNDANPVSPAEIEERKEAEAFLAGENGSAAPERRPTPPRKRSRK